MNSDESSNIKRIGDHTVQFEPPDICTIRFGEAVTVEDAREIYAEELRFAEEHGEIFLLSDLSRVRTISPEVRKKSAEMTTSPFIVGAVNFGLSFHVRVLATLVIKLRRLAKAPLDGIYFMAADEAEARAIIAEQRRVRLERKGMSGRHEGARLSGGAMSTRTFGINRATPVRSRRCAR